MFSGHFQMLQSFSIGWFECVSADRSEQQEKHRLSTEVPPWTESSAAAAENESMNKR